MFSDIRFKPRLSHWSGIAALIALLSPAINAAAAPTTIVAQSSGKCLDVIGGTAGTANGVLLEQWTCVAGAANQAFTLQEMGGGRYQIIASHSNKCVGAVNGGTANGTRIEQRDCAKLPQQIWSIDSTATAGQYKIVSPQSGRCLAVNGSTADGVLMALADCTASSNQSWKLAVPAVSPPVTVVSKLSGKCLDVIGGGTGLGNGVKLEQWSCAPGAGNQAFTFRFFGNDQYQIVAKHSGKCVEVAAASTANGAVIHQWDCNGTPQQRWRVNSLAGGYSQIVSAPSGKCLDVTGGATATGDGALMELWDCAAGAGNQTWLIGAAPVTTTTTSTTSTTVKPTTTSTTAKATTTTSTTKATTTTTTKASTTSTTARATTTTTTTTTTVAQACTPTDLTPAIATQAAWDARYFGKYGQNLPNVSGGAEDFAWQGHYWVRAYVSMAKTYGDTKYLELAVRMIDYWLARTDGPQGWGTSLGPSQLSLDTGVISEAITLFSYAVWTDPRFATYRPIADRYITQVEPLLRSYNNQWVDNAPYPGSPSFYVYASCGGVCSPASLMMYNQGTVLAKPLMMIDRIKRLKGQAPDAAYLYKAGKVAAYFKTFVRLSGNAYNWDYGGARGSGMEDVSHGHLDLQFLLWARKYNVGGLTDTDMTRLAATMHKIMTASNDVALKVDGSGAASADSRWSVGYDWIDLADYDRSLLDKAINIYNRHNASPNSARPFLGWAEIQRKRSCVSLY